MIHEVVETDEGQVIRLEGPLTFKDEDTFAKVVDTLKQDGDERRILDISGIERIDSAGLGMFLKAREAAREGELELVLRGASGKVKNVMAMAKFETLFTME